MRWFDDCLQPFVERAARQHHPAAAGEAFQANIGANAGDAPFITAARVLFTQADNIAGLNMDRHGAEL